MPKLRVFISHSARGEPETLLLLDDLRKGLEGIEEDQEKKFAVLIDKDDLDPGVLWRQTLNTWIGGCDVAIVLLTEKALESDYVQYEATVLRYRETSIPEDKCTVIPVLIAPVDAAQVNATRGFMASQITESQGIVVGSIADAPNRGKIVTTIKMKLEGLVRVKSPLEEQELFLEDLFRRKVPETTVIDALDKLNVDLGGWNVNNFRSLSLAMLSRGLDKQSVGVIKDIRSYIRDRKELEKLFESVATSWIDLRSTRCLRRIALGDRQQRVVALDGTNDFIARKYVSRATPRSPMDPWNLAPITAAFSEKPLEDLSREIESSLRQAICLDDREDLQGYLQNEDENDSAVFVAIPAAGVTTKILDELRLKFPTVTFFLLAGQDENVLSAIAAQKIELLVPPLTKDFKESEIVMNYEKQRLGAVETYLRQNRL